MKVNELLEQINNDNLPKNIAIILDGNGRWATKRGLPRTAGHAEGIKTLVKITKESKELGIKSLTVYAFSTENWNRPTEEVNYLMNAFVENIHLYKNNLVSHQIKVNIIGEKEHLNNDILDSIADIESSTKDFNDFILNICFNYGGKKEIIHVVKEILNDQIDINQIDEKLIESKLYMPLPIDLLIRTGGEQRISNFLPWQLSYTEMYFTKTLWPDFKKKDLMLAVKDYESRNRRFGGIKK